ncbi:hypothetical protein QE152_g18141 [Popillia japonica]|uniref:Uncharacterized protein n=2 Tax=Popillia japonica TaxID=7064 RepID=A0AAW1L5G0_POPJA
MRIVKLSKRERGPQLRYTLKKRKRTTTPLLEKEVKLASAENGSWDDVSKMVAKVLKRTRELKKLVNESSKTKIEIKQLARELDCLVEILDKKASRYENSLDFPVERISKPKLEKSTQTVSTGCSVGIQTEAKNIEMEKLRAEDRNRNESQVALKTGNGFAGISNFLDKTWPRDLYTRTRIERVDASNMTSDGDFAFLLDPKCIEESKKMESVMMVYPDIKDFIAKNEGQIDYLIKTVATKTRYQETSEKITGLYFIPIEINKEGVNRMEDIYDIIKSLENITQVHPTDKLKLLVAEGLNVGYVRKLCEYIFCDTGVSVLLLTTQDESKLTTNKEKRAPTEKVIVKTGNIGYANLFKTVKERVNLNTVGVNIKTIRKTMGGDLMLEVNGDRRKANALREAISSKTNLEAKLVNSIGRTQQNARGLDK